jgi:hypothetical protein
MKQSFNNVMVVIAGTLLLPIFIALFMSDRVILLFMPWVQQLPITLWWKKTEAIFVSVIRVGVVGLVYGLYKFIAWMV